MAQDSALRFPVPEWWVIRMADRLELMLKQYFRGWDLEEEIGNGKTGKVYRVVKTDAGNRYTAALKWIECPRSSEEYDLLEDRGLSEEEIKNYYDGIAATYSDEIAIMARLRGNSHVVSLNDYCLIKRPRGGFDLLIMMEELDSLANQECKSDVKEAVKVGKDICMALTDLAKEGLVHRDIKPENIYRNRNGNYKLGDFGITGRPNEENDRGVFRGTPLYAAPETISGQNSDARADVYSLGLVLYKMLNRGFLPFEALCGTVLTDEQRAHAAKRRINGETFERPALGSDALALIVMKACAFSPDDRFDSADAMFRALNSLSETELENVVFGNDESPKECPAKESTETITARVNEEVPLNPRWGVNTQEEEISFESDEAARKREEEKQNRQREKQEAREARIKREEDKAIRAKRLKLSVLALIILVCLVVLGGVLVHKKTNSIRDITCTATGIGQMKLQWKAGGSGPWQVRISEAQTNVVVWENTTDEKQQTFGLIPGRDYLAEISGDDADTQTLQFAVPMPEKYEGDIRQQSVLLFTYRIRSGETMINAAGRQMASSITLKDGIGKEGGDGYFILGRYVNTTDSTIYAECLLWCGNVEKRQKIEMVPTGSDGNVYYISLNEILTEVKSREEKLEYYVIVEECLLDSGVLTITDSEVA